MKFFQKSKDGGPESTVTGYFLVEIKPLFSIVLLRFDRGTRPAYHNHAFNCISWVLKGWLSEIILGGGVYNRLSYWMPFITKRSTFHQVYSHGVSWVLSFRGPWSKEWKEYLPDERCVVTLSDGRIIKHYENGVDR